MDFLGCKSNSPPLSLLLEPSRKRESFIWDAWEDGRREGGLLLKFYRYVLSFVSRSHFGMLEAETTK